MHEFWKTPTANMAYTRLQNHINTMVGKHGIQIREVVVVMSLLLLLSFDIFVPTSAHLLLFLDKWFPQISLNVGLWFILLIINPSMSLGTSLCPKGNASS
jgi:hypothetical protein